MITRKLFVISIVSLLSAVCVAQETGRWSVEAVGSVGINYAPTYSAGVQTTFNIFTDGHLRLGIGAGLRVARPLSYIARESTSGGEIDARFLGAGHKIYADKSGVYIPLFLSVGWYASQYGNAAHPFVRLDAGYLLSTARDDRSKLKGLLLEPQVGVFFRNGFFASVGFWAQQSLRQEKTDVYYYDGTMQRSGLMTIRSLTPSISLHLGVRF